MTEVLIISYEPAPTGEYGAKVVAIDEEEGNYGPQFRWTFEIVKPAPYAGKQLTGWTSTSPSMKGKLVRWAGACLGRPITPGECLDTDTLIGAMVTLVVTVKVGNDGGEFNRVEDLRTYKRTPQMPVTPPPVDIVDPFGDD